MRKEGIYAVVLHNGNKREFSDVRPFTDSSGALHMLRTGRSGEVVCMAAYADGVWSKVERV
jgi:hypothetical protein